MYLASGTLPSRVHASRDRDDRARLGLIALMYRKTMIRFFAEGTRYKRLCPWARFRAGRGGAHVSRIDRPRGGAPQTTRTLGTNNYMRSDREHPALKSCYTAPHESVPEVHRTSSSCAFCMLYTR